MKKNCLDDLPRQLTVGEVAERSGVAISAIHFYEAKGLIKSTRSKGNQRRYSRDILRRIAIIKVAQKVGISLSSIKLALMDLPGERTPSGGDWGELSARWRNELDEKIAMLTSLRNQLSDCIGCGCLSLSICKLRNPMDELSLNGSGAQRLLDKQP